MTGKKESTDAEDHRIRMAELVKRSGVPKSTILYYLSEGLLPEPARPKPNVALYDPICVDLIRYIRAAQEMHRYPLSWIRGNIKHIMAGTPPEELLRLGQRLLGDESKVVTFDEAARSAGIDPADIARYIEIGLVRPARPNELDAADETIIELVAQTEQAGLPPEAFSEVVEAIHAFDAATQRLVGSYLGVPADPRQISRLIDMLSRLQPYLVRRFLQEREL